MHGWKLAWVVVLLGGCEGVIGEPGGEIGTDVPGARGGSAGAAGTSSRAPDAPPIGVAPPAQSDDGLCAEPRIEAGVGQLRHLTRLQYANTVRDLLGVVVSDTSESSDTEVRTFPSNAGAFIDSQRATELQLSAERIADEADLDSLVPCDLPSIDSTCARAFIESFGRRAFRRPLSGEEADRYLALYDIGRAEVDAEDGLRRVIGTMLQSPYFLYLVELGESGEGLVHLGPYELASRLSYFLWNTMPDDTLLEAAPGLTESTGREAQARRMLDDPKAQGSVMRFFEHWLGLDDIERAPLRPTEYPEFNADLANALKHDLLELVRRVVFDGDARLSTLLNASYTFSDQEIRELYGLGSPDAEGRVQWPAGERSGILTHPAILAVHGRADITPVARGLFIRRRLLCQGVPLPPDNVDTSASREGAGNPRERWSEHVSSSECASCHNYIDPLGWPFEQYDQLGRWRTEYEGWTIEAHGEIVGTDVDGRVEGPIELATRLSESRYVEACVAQQLFVYAHGRDIGSEDECTLRELTDVLSGSGGDLRELLVAMVASDSFALRHVEQAQ